MFYLFLEMFLEGGHHDGPRLLAGAAQAQPEFVDLELPAVDLLDRSSPDSGPLYSGVSSKCLWPVESQPQGVEETTRMAVAAGIAHCCCAVCLRHPQKREALEVMG